MAEREKCLIIGASGGIGRQLAALLGAKGWELVLGGRRAEPLQAIAAEVGGTTVALDAADFAAVEGAFSDHPGITAAVNLAGSILLKPAHTTSAEEFDQIGRAHV